MIAKLIFALCAVTALLCAWLLIRGYMRSRTRLLLWSGICFILLSLSNLLIIADRWFVPDVSLALPRLFTTLLGMMLLVYGLIWENE